jgi:hypothetical protein
MKVVQHELTVALVCTEQDRPVKSRQKFHVAVSNSLLKMSVHPIDSRQDRPELVSAQERGLSELQLAFAVDYRLTAAQNLHNAFHEAVKPIDTNNNPDVAIAILELFRLERPLRQQNREFPAQDKATSFVQ